MSEEQYKIQSAIFAPSTYEHMTREQAKRDLIMAGVLHEDGTLKEEYKFLDPNYVFGV